MPSPSFASPQRNSQQHVDHEPEECARPDLVLATSNWAAETKMMTQAMTKVIEGGDFVRAVDIENLSHFNDATPESHPDWWKKLGLIFTICYEGANLYPRYALDLQDGPKPMPIMKNILSALQDKDDWQKAFWFASPNTYLKNKAPKELLKTKPQDVLRAAETESEGIQHG